LGILYCSRAEMEHCAGNPHAAGAALAEAGEIAAAVGAGAESELGLALARVRTLRGPSRNPELTAQAPENSELLGEARIQG
jgi:hypothetical protein